MLRQSLRQNVTRQRNFTGRSIPAPVGGWDTEHALSDMPPDRAFQLVNWFPQPGYVQPRRFEKTHCDTGGGSPVESIMPYHGMTANRLFAAAGSNIYDVTTATPATDVPGLANARWQHINFTTSAGHYLWICNGADTPRVYDGSSWAAASITGITSSEVIQVAAHKSRIWMVRTGSTAGAYLPLDSFQGAATEFEFGSFFTRGGILQAIGTMSHDASDGPDEYLVAVSSRGQCVIFAGTDPGSNYLHQGTFVIGEPIGRRCLLDVGGDLAVITVDGIESVAEAFAKSRSARVRLTSNIKRGVNDATRLYKANFGWELTEYAQGTRAILNVPVAANTTQHQYVMNTQTGAWAWFTGQNANCWAIYQEDLYFGGNDGVVYLGDSATGDATSSVDCDMKLAFNYFGMRGVQKRFLMCQPLVSTDGSFLPTIAINTDFRDDATLTAAVTTADDRAKWDVALWDVDVWPDETLFIADKIAISGVGQCASVRMRLNIQASEGLDPSQTQINGFHVTFETGEYL